MWIAPEFSDKDGLAKESKRKEKSSKKSNAEIEVQNAPASPGVVKPEDDLRETESNLFYIGGDKALISDLMSSLSTDSSHCRNTWFSRNG